MWIKFANGRSIGKIIKEETCGMRNLRERQTLRFHRQLSMLFWIHRRILAIRICSHSLGRPREGFVTASKMALPGSERPTQLHQMTRKRRGCKEWGRNRVGDMEGQNDCLVAGVIGIYRQLRISELRFHAVHTRVAPAPYRRLGPHLRVSEPARPEPPRLSPRGPRSLPIHWLFLRAPLCMSCSL